MGPNDHVVSGCKHVFHRRCMATYAAEAPEDTILACPVCYLPITVDVRDQDEIDNDADTEAATATAAPSGDATPKGDDACSRDTRVPEPAGGTDEPELSAEEMLKVTTKRR